MKYSKQVTLSHTQSINYPNCLIQFNKLLVDEGYVGTLSFHSDVILLNTDCLEIAQALNQNRNRYSSMDCMFGISNSSKNEIVLVEFKFENKNPNQLVPQKLIDKVNGTKSALGNSFIFNSDYIFIFNSNLLEQARSWFFRKCPRIFSLNYIAMDIESLKNEYF